MDAMPFLRITGSVSPQATSFSLTVADNGAPVSLWSSDLNQATRQFAIVVRRPQGFTAVDLTVSAAGVDVMGSGFWAEIDSLVMSDAPVDTGKFQSRSVPIHGSQRTELSLSVLGLDSPGTSPVQLGGQVLVYTAASESGQPKFVDCRATDGTAGGVMDSAAASGYYNVINNTALVTFGIPSVALKPGNYVAVASVASPDAGAHVLRARARIGGVSGASGGYQETPFTVASQGAWPVAAAGQYVLLPLALLRLPPADTDRATAQVYIDVACTLVNQAHSIRLDNVWLADLDDGQLSLVLAGTATEIRLDAATVDRPQPSLWTGAVGGLLVADASKWIGEQHQAAPGMLQVVSVTPGCDTSRLSLRYYPRYKTHVAPLVEG
jgi:hypothetical protein